MSRGERTAALEYRAHRLTDTEAASLYRAMIETWGAGWLPAVTAAWDAARSAGRIHELADALPLGLGIARAGTWDAVTALVVRDLVSGGIVRREHYDQLARPWATAIGPVHPDDPDIRENNNEGINQ